MSKYSEADDYIEQVCSYIKFPLIRKKAANELMNHIDDKVFEYVHLGVDSKEAGLRAIEEMGASEEVGRSINNLYTPQINKIFIAAIIVMLTVGLVLRCYMDVINHELADSFFVNSIQYAACIVILLVITFSRFSRAREMRLTVLIFGGIIIGACIVTQVLNLSWMNHYIRNSLVIAAIPIYITVFYISGKQGWRGLLLSSVIFILLNF